MWQGSRVILAKIKCSKWALFFGVYEFLFKVILTAKNTACFHPGDFGSTRALVKCWDPA